MSHWVLMIFAARLNSLQMLQCNMVRYVDTGMHAEILARFSRWLKPKCIQHITHACLTFPKVTKRLR